MAGGVKDGKRGRGSVCEMTIVLPSIDPFFISMTGDGNEGVWEKVAFQMFYMFSSK